MSGGPSLLVRPPLVVLMALLVSALGGPPVSGAEPLSGGEALLTQRHYWRKHYTTFPPVFADEGAQAPRPDSLAAMFPEAPPSNWAAPDFDDDDWLLAPGQEFEHGVKDLKLIGEMSQEGISTRLRGTDPFLPAVGLVCLRGRFAVADRTKVRRLTLALSCRGGFVAYLNGVEVARAHLPEGNLRPGTPAEAYPPEAFFYRDSLEKGRPRPLDTNDLRCPQWALRERAFGPVAIPLGPLRNGANVLAIEMHRGTYPPQCMRQPDAIAATVGLGRLELRLDAQDGATRTGPGGIQVWTVDTTRTLFEPALSAANESRGKVRIVGARNGTFAGQAIVASDEPLRGLSARAAALKQVSGSGLIPAEAIRVRYGVPNPFWPDALRQMGMPVTPPRWKRDAGAEGGTRFDMLLDAPPANATAVAIWVSARVPKGAPAGRYTGELAIEAQGRAFAGTLELHVCDWTLPDVKDYATLLHIYQSPDTLARYYKVEPWSDAHWRLIEKSLALMGEMGNIGLLIPLLAESQMGNPESLVPWLKQPDGSYRYDFSRFDRYLDAALKTHGRLRFVSLNAWGYEASNRTWKGPRDYASFYGARVTVIDPATGRRESVKLPQYGTPECEAAWRPLLVALHERLKAKGLGDRVVLGIAGDMGPDPPTAAMFRRILPEAGWLAESHQPQRAYVYDPATKATVPVRWNSVVYGGDIPDPAVRRLYGWQYDPNQVILNFNRSGSALLLIGFPPPWSFRMWMESTLVYGRAGNGRVGGDYWHIGAQLLGDGKPDWGIVGGSGGTLFNRYFHSHADETGLGRSCTDLFAPGPDGPVTTIRLECAREGNQEAEARVFIEKALLNKHQPLPADLARSCQQLLDVRTNLMRLWRLRCQDIAPFGWQERSRRLFDAAGEVATALASHKE